MARINIPIDALTSRLNLGDRFSGLRSQTIGQRFANLKPISEFLDLKRVSKPRDFGDVQARVNYNLAYFSSNYAVVFVMLAIYSLLSNWWLLFDIILVVGGMWSIGKLGGNDLEIAGFRATTSQLYTALACFAIPIAFIASPLSSFLWLTYRECFFRGGGLGGRPRAPYDVPRWGRPPGARLGRNRDAWGRYQSWDADPRFEEVEDSDEDGFHGVEIDHGYAQNRFYSDELRFDGIDLGSRALRRRRSEDIYYDDDPSYSDDDGGQPDSSALVHRQDRQVVMRQKEEELVERALERIARARALGKTNVKLSQAEIDALDRLDQSQQQQQQQQKRKPVPTPKTAPKSKKTSPSKGKAVEAKKTRRGDKAESPKPTATSSRSRGRSSASDRSIRDVEYPVPPLDVGYGYPPPGPGVGYPSGYFGPTHTASRTPSSQSLQRMRAPPYQHPYEQGRFHSNPDDAYSYRPASRSSRVPRPDPSEPDWEPKARSNSSLVNYPLDQLPNHTHTSRAPRFDPSDPRFGSPQRRVASGPADVRYYRGPPPDEELEVMSYMVPSSGEESEDSSQGVRVEVRDRPSPVSGGNYTIRTTRGAAATPKSSSNSKGTVGRGARKR